MSARLPRPPRIVEPALDDPSIIEALVKRGSPYWSVQRYVRNHTEMAALSDAGRAAAAGGDDGSMFIAPWFRGDWAYDGPLVEGVEPILENPAFLEAARAMFPGATIRPQIVYVNLNPPMPQVDPGHTDVPAFRGFDRTRYPVWLLVTMLRSGLFERWYVPMVTAVSWYYDGPGGGFRYWPDGPDAPPIDRPCISNTAVAGDNDVMFHCVHQVGPVGARIRMTKGLTLDSQLVYRDGSFDIEERGRVLASFPYEAVRISVSWKALVFEDARALSLYDEGADPLTAEQVERIFLEDLRQRGLEVAPPLELCTDARFMNALLAAYRQAPSVFEPR